MPTLICVTPDDTELNVKLLTLSCSPYESEGEYPSGSDSGSDSCWPD